jgi:hypothetical protein
MTESEFLDCPDPSRLLQFLRSRYAFPNETTSNRKLRLFSCACCRRIWQLLTDEGRRAVELSELYADGLGTKEETEAAGRAVLGAATTVTGVSSNSSIAYAAADSAFGSFNSFNVITSLNSSDHSSEGAAHCALLRDIFGNPFHPVVIDPSWLTSTVLALARQMHDSRDFSAMPILADALQDVGCENEELLNHCRISGLHVRGCWGVDLLLGNTVKVGSWNHRLRDAITG